MHEHVYHHVITKQQLSVSGCRVPLATVSRMPSDNARPCQKPNPGHDSYRQQLLFWKADQPQAVGHSVRLCRKQHHAQHVGQGCPVLKGGRGSGAGALKPLRGVHFTYPHREL